MVESARINLLNVLSTMVTYGIEHFYKYTAIFLSSVVTVSQEIQDGDIFNLGISIIFMSITLVRNDLEGLHLHTMQVYAIP